MASETARPLWKKMIRRVMIVLLVPLALLALTSVVLRVAASKGEREALDGWSRIGRPMDAFEKRWPKRETNGPAGRIEVLCRPMGIDLAMDRDVKRDFSQPFAKELSPYCAGLWEDPSGHVPPIPEVVAAALDDHSDALEEIRSILLGGERPLWKLDISALYAAQMPRFVDQMDLQRVLLLRVLRDALEGRPDEALQWMEASWALNEITLARPELISKMVGIAVRRWQFATLRKTGLSSGAWRPRLADSDLGPTLLDAYQYEAWLFMKTCRGAEDPFRALGGEDPGAVQRFLMRHFGFPYYTLCASQSSEAFREFVERMARETSCTPDTQALSEDLEGMISGWNILAAVAFPDFSQMWERTVRLRLEADLTRLVLEAGAARASGEGSWPAALPAAESCPCPGMSWRYTRDGEGHIEIRIENAPPTDKAGIPLWFTSRPPDTAAGDPSGPDGDAEGR